MPQWLDNIKNNFSEKSKKDVSDPCLDHDLSYSVYTAEFETAELLIEQGATPNSDMLLYCVNTGRTPMARLLINNKAEPNQEMLRIALEKKDTEMALLIMSKGIKPNQEMSDYIKKQKSLSPLLNPKASLKLQT